MFAFAFDTSKHPRDADGRFISTGGSADENPSEENWWEFLTSDETHAINDYTRGGYYPINRALRDGGDLEIDWDDKGTTMRNVIDRLDSAIAFSMTSESMSVYRGISGDFSKRLGQMKVGQNFSDPSYASTSSDKSYAKHLASKGDASAVMEIRVPKGYHALPVSKISAMPGEAEVLLKRNSTFKLVSKSDNHFVFEVH